MHFCNSTLSVAVLAIRLNEPKYHCIKSPLHSLNFVAKCFGFFRDFINEEYRYGITG